MGGLMIRSSIKKTKIIGILIILFVIIYFLPFSSSQLSRSTSFNIGPQGCVKPDLSTAPYFIVNKSTYICPGQYDGLYPIKVICSNCFLNCLNSVINQSIITWNANNIKIMNCNINSDNDSPTGIFLLLTNNSIVKNNNIKFPNLTGDWGGIEIRENSNSNIIRDNIITGYWIEGSGSYGVRAAWYVTNNTIINNTISGFKYCISTSLNAANNTIISNTISKCEHGIKPYFGSREEKVIGNLVYDTEHDGIYLVESGILTTKPNNSIISDNIVYNSHNCIRIESSETTNPQVKNNLLSNCEEGISVFPIFFAKIDSDALITNNTIFNNTHSGIMILSVNGVLVYHNNLIDNMVQAIDGGIRNKWNNSNIGNFWYNYNDSSEGCFDRNLDGICDSPFPVLAENGSIKTYDYLPSVKPFM